MTMKTALRRDVVQDEKLFRPTDIHAARANRAKAAARTSDIDVAQRMLASRRP